MRRLRVAGIDIQLESEDLDRIAERLLDRVQQIMIGDEDAAHLVPRLLVVKEVAEILRMPLSKVYDMLKDDHDPIPSLRIGEKAIRVDPRELHRWLKDHPNVAADALSTR